MSLVVLIAIVFSITRHSSTTSFVAKGTPIPILPEGDLRPVSEMEFEGILVGLRGKPVIVNVWASWCSPCRTETPLLERAWRQHNESVVILGVASRDVRPSAAAFLEEFGVTYPTLFDDSGAIRSALGVRGFPTTYIFNANGELQSTIVGGLTEQRLAAVLKDLQA